LFAADVAAGPGEEFCAWTGVVRRTSVIANAAIHAVANDRVSSRPSVSVECSRAMNCTLSP
jgi:hypothetical protein